MAWSPAVSAAAACRFAIQERKVATTAYSISSMEANENVMASPSPVVDQLVEQQVLRALEPACAGT